MHQPAVVLHSVDVVVVVVVDAHPMDGTQHGPSYKQDKARQLLSLLLTIVMDTITLCVFSSALLRGCPTQPTCLREDIWRTCC